MEDNPYSYSIPESTISWLLASQTPSIRYLTLTEIIRKEPDDALVLKTRSEIENSAYIQAILADQTEEGFWYSARHYYGPKYRSSHWAMYLLAELGLPPEHPAMQKGADFMIRRMEEYAGIYQDRPSIWGENGGISCLWGNWLLYQIYCGNSSHPLVQQIIKYICSEIQRDGSCAYNSDLPCSWGVIRCLNALAMIPEKKRTKEMLEAITHGVAFILSENGENLITGDYPTQGNIHPIWKQISFPLFYQTDVLFTLRVLAKLNALKSPGAQKALNWLADRQNAKGTWRGASPYKSRTHPFLIPPDTPSHWVTLHAVSVLSSANRQTPE